MMFLITRARTNNEYWNEAPDVVIMEITERLIVLLNEAISWLHDGHDRFGDRLQEIHLEWWGCDWLVLDGETIETLSGHDLGTGILIDSTPPDDMYPYVRMGASYISLSFFSNGTRPEIRLEAVPKYTDDIVYSEYISVDSILNPESVVKVDWVAEHANYASDDGGQEGDEDSDA